MMRTTVLLAAIAMLGSAAGASAASAATLDGATLHSQYLYSTGSSVYADYGETTVSGNTLLSNTLGGVNGIALSASGSAITASFAGAAYSSGWSTAAFNGFTVFDDTNSLAAITSVTLGALTNMKGFDASRVTFDADHIYVNWQGLSFDHATTVQLLVSTVSAAPEPGTWAMMILGFGLAGVALRRAARRQDGIAPRAFA